MFQFRKFFSFFRYFLKGQFAVMSDDEDQHSLASSLVEQIMATCKEICDTRIESILFNAVEIVALGIHVLLAT